MVSGSTFLFSWLVDTGFNTLVTFLALFLACLTAFEETRHTRLFGTALITRVIESVPVLMAGSAGMVSPQAEMMALTISYIVMVPLLASWVGMGGAKAIYVTLLVAMFVGIFSFLVMASA
jgi:hypothetical protein